MLRIPVFCSDTANKGKYRQRGRSVLFSVCGSRGSQNEHPEMELSVSADPWRTCSCPQVPTAAVDCKALNLDWIQAPALGH